MGMKQAKAMRPIPADYAIGSLESRASARTLLERNARESRIVFRIKIVHIGHNGRDPLPPTRQVKWPDGIAEFIHVSDTER